MEELQVSRIGVASVSISIGGAVVYVSLAEMLAKLADAMKEPVPDNAAQEK